MSNELLEFEEAIDPRVVVIMEQYEGIGLDSVLEDLIKEGYIKATKSDFYLSILRVNNEDVSRRIVELLGKCKELLIKLERIRNYDVTRVRNNTRDMDTEISQEIGSNCGEIHQLLRG